MRSIYRLFVGQKWITPSDFWSLPPGEVWWIIDAMTEKHGGGKLAPREYDDLLKMVHEAQAAERAEKDET